MIESKEDYRYYLLADRVALNIPAGLPALKHYFVHRLWKYEKILRKEEYYTNVKGRLWRPHLFLIKYRKERLGLKLGGIEIPSNVFGPGLSIAHYGMLIVNGRARVGKNCRVHNGVHIGVAMTVPYDIHATPTIGDNVFIGPGACIYGKINIADGIAIGANSVVNQSFDEPGITIAGAPARKVSDKGSKTVFFRATERIEETGCHRSSASR